jgi:hypothetical protein
VQEPGLAALSDQPFKFQFQAPPTRSARKPHTLMAEPQAAASQFTVVPPPWVTKCNVYCLLFPTRAGSLPADAYSPLEAASSFSDPTQAGAFKGGMGFVMIIRYFETPIGPYNEMVYMPGYFEVPREGANDAARVTRIYVDHKSSAYNGQFCVHFHADTSFLRSPTTGRLSGNFPKHLVRFTFSTLCSPDRITVQVFIPDPSVTTPFFSATIQPFHWFPSFPFSSRALVTQPPVPASTQDEEELCGTDMWVRLPMTFTCRKAKLGWVAVEQPSREGEGARLPRWWPEIKPWRVGLCLEDAILDLGTGEFFE